jgi:hypothetical protein
MESGFIAEPPQTMLNEALDWAVAKFEHPK